MKTETFAEGDEFEIAYNNFNGIIYQAKYIGTRDVNYLESFQYTSCHVFQDERGEKWSFVIDKYSGKLVALYYYFRPGHPVGESVGLTYVIRPKTIKPML